MKGSHIGSVFNGTYFIMIHKEYQYIYLLKLRLFGDEPVSMLAFRLRVA
jgi:hypothetical protein